LSLTTKIKNNQNETKKYLNGSSVVIVRW
jgi:hypothetical protein